jgi:hypothetical protein
MNCPGVSLCESHFSDIGQTAGIFSNKFAFDHCARIVSNLNDRTLALVVTMSEDGAKGGANLLQSMALGGAAASIAVNFTHPIVRCVDVCDGVTVMFEQQVYCASDWNRWYCSMEFHGATTWPCFLASILLLCAIAWVQRKDITTQSITLYRHNHTGNGQDSHASEWSGYWYYHSYVISVGRLGRLLEGPVLCLWPRIELYEHQARRVRTGP